jgi:hypothetical protein
LLVQLIGDGAMIVNCRSHANDALMSNAVWNQGWRHQYERMLRSIVKIAGPFRSADEYDDAFYHAAQDAWHLKDWIKNDNALPKDERTAIVAAVHDDPDLLVVRDIANGTKHLGHSSEPAAELHSSSVVVHSAAEQLDEKS